MALCYCFSDIRPSDTGTKLKVVLFLVSFFLIGKRGKTEL